MVVADKLAASFNDAKCFVMHMSRGCKRRAFGGEPLAVEKQLASAAFERKRADAATDSVRVGFIDNRLPASPFETGSGGQSG